MDAEAFREMRIRLGVNQTTLAKMLGVHPVTVNKWEHGGNITQVVELAMWALTYMNADLIEKRRRRPAAPNSADAGGGE